MKNISHKPAFTMIELVFVVVVLGILAAVAIPRLENDSRQEAADQILSDIRYTQHLALTDDVTKPNRTQWQRAFWQIEFQDIGIDNTGWSYTIGSNRDGGTQLDLAESALDPLNAKPLYGNRSYKNPNVSSKVFVEHRYGISAIDFTKCGGTKYIGFDHMGRPHKGFSNSIFPNYATILKTPCQIRFTHPNGDFDINITQETGYAFIVKQEN